MKYRVEFDTVGGEVLSDADVDEAVIKLRTLANELEQVRGDDLMVTFPDGTRGLQGWWSK